MVAVTVAALLSTVLLILAKSGHVLVKDAGGLLGSDAAHALSDMHPVAHWSLTALLLYWLGRRRQGLYIRGSLALMLFSVLTFSIHAGIERQFAPVSSLGADFMTTPSVYAGWYVLMALVLHAAFSAPWIRAGAVISAALVVVLAALTADGRVIGSLTAGGLPVLSWYIARLLLDRNQTHEAEQPVPLGRNGGWGA
ncbi:hypothetical protein [Streptomyces sp. NPDC051098]|uniref:hypothetical protein n=1 Tax=Streptomyces sp. NPDC051098 TaxID=3155411 RepID=UPI00344A7A97